MSFYSGSSFGIDNPAIAARRALLGLEAPIRLQFHEITSWTHGNPLFDWYRRRPRQSQGVWKAQLRKERHSWYHEYIVIALGDPSDATYFRIDRQPRSNVPYRQLCNEGCEAIDTIEQITSFNDLLYPSSDCLIEVEFELLVDLAYVLKTCYAIYHSPAGRYTVQRYNCYFFSQTILHCLVRRVWCLSMGDQPEVALHTLTTPRRLLIFHFSKEDAIQDKYIPGESIPLHRTSTRE